MTPEVLKKLESLLQADFDAATNNIMLPNPDGSYHLFGRYNVCENADVVEVFRGTNKVQEFSGLRQALSWCIAEKYQQTGLSSEIVRLDRDYRRLKNMDSTLANLVPRIKDRDRRFVARIKCEDNIYRLNVVQQQLTKCISRAKYLQIKGFNDEIARTRRPAPHRTSRPGPGKSNRSKN